MALATKTRYTLADLLEQDPRDETIYDVFGGELVVFTSPDNPHASVVFELLAQMVDADRAGYGRVRTAPLAVAFDFAERGVQAEDVTHPDILFIREDRVAIMGGRCVEAAPDLVIEVLSPSTRRDDLPGGAKWAIYERYGVSYYWIVDIERRTVTQYQWRDGQYGEPAVVQAGDVLSCPLFPGVEIDTRRLFARIVP